MTTIERLQKDLEIAKLTLKVAQACKVIILAHKERSTYTFKNELRKDTTTSLFEEELISCNNINITTETVKSFESSYLLNFDTRYKKTKGIKAAIMTFEKNENIALDLLFKLISENQIINN